MDIREALIEEHSKERTLEIVQYIGANEARMAELMDIFFAEDYRLNQRSSWVLNFVSERHPELIRPYLEDMVKNLDEPRHDAVIRNTIRYFEKIDLPESLMGIIADKCFAYLTSPEIPVAIRVFSMSTLYNISVKYPELQAELALIIEEHLPYGSAGYKSRGKKILKKIKQNASKSMK